MDRAGVLSRRQHGATLVELMVAMTLGLLVVAGAGRMFVDMRQTFALASAVSARQADAGFVTQQLMRDVRTAEAIEIDGGALTLSLNGDQGAAYCGAPQTSLELTYRLAESGAGNVLEVLADCGSEASVVINGVEVFAPTWTGGGEPHGVSLALTLAETDRLPVRTLSFSITSRQLALRQAVNAEE